MASANTNSREVNVGVVYIHGRFEGAGTFGDPTNVAGELIDVQHAGSDGEYSVHVSGSEGGLEVISTSCAYVGADLDVSTNVAFVNESSRTVAFRVITPSVGTGRDLSPGEFLYFTIVARKASHEFTDI